MTQAIGFQLIRKTFISFPMSLYTFFQSNLKKRRISRAHLKSRDSFFPGPAFLTHRNKQGESQKINRVPFEDENKTHYGKFLTIVSIFEAC